MSKFPKPVKVFDLSGDMLMRGLCVNKAGFQGGLFRQASDFDPFSAFEVMVGSPTKQERGAGTVAGTIKQFVGYTSGGLSYAAGLADGKYYKIACQAGTVTDLSAQISGITTFRGAVRYKGRILYASDSKFKSNTIDPVLASEVDLVTGLETANHVAVVGPDKLVYFLNLYKIGRITNVTGSTGNSDNVFAFDSDVVLRDIDHDGQLLIVVGDTNAVVPASGNSRCFVAFWNMASGNLTQLYEIKDESYLSGVAVDGDDVLVFGKNNYYLCNSLSKPKPLLPLTGSNSVITTNPVSPWAIVDRRGSILWTDGGNDGRIFGYGSPKPSIIPKAFHQPFTSAAQPQAIFWDGAVLYSSAGGKLYSHDAATYDAVYAILPAVKLKRAYTFSHALVILRTTLNSGQSIKLQMQSADGYKVLMNDTVKTYSTDPGAHVLTFYPSPAGSSYDAAVFNDIQVSLLGATGGAQVVGLEVYGIPLFGNAGINT